MAKICISIRNIILFLSLTNTPVSAQEIEWQNSIGGSGDDWINSIERTFDGGYILGCSSVSNISGDKTENCIGNDDYWIIKVDLLGNIQWQNTIGGVGSDYLMSIISTADGGFFLGGVSNSGISGDKTDNFIGSGNAVDFWVLKTDSLGNILWQKTIGGSGNDFLNAVEVTNDGGYILGGRSNSNISGNKTENSFGQDDYWFVKLDSIGNVEWDKTIGGSSDDFLYSIQQTIDNGFILGGMSESNISGVKNENCIGGEDFWILKIDEIGTIQWQNTIGGSGSELFTSIKQNSDGGYLVSGSSASDISGDKTENSVGDLGYTDYWIIKTDSLGNIQWDKTIGGNCADRLNSLRLTNDGGYLLGGWSCSDISGSKTEKSLSVLGYTDYWVIKMDSLNQIQWQNTIGGSVTDLYSTMNKSENEEIVIGGISLSNMSEDKLENCIGGWDFWILKLSESLNSITGNLYADLNSNGLKDINEPFLSGRKIIEQNTGRFAFTDQNGNYILSVLDTGNFTVSPQLVNWFSTSPISHTATFTTIHQTDSLNDFVFQPQGTFEDVCITITPMGNFRSGFPANYMISYGNYGTTTVTPTVYFYPNINLTYQSATLTPNQITLDSVVWNLPALTPFQTGSIIVTVNVNLGLPIGTLINSSAHIEPYLTDDNPSCNNSNWEVYTTGSFDPNDILVSEDTLTTTQLSNAPWLDYIIRFQNTGNDTAFTVKILNPIDTNKLNIASIEFVNASHPVDLSWINYQRNMEFKFENILLVDSNANEPLSHGFVRYRIQPQTNLSAGDSITNFAAIYFDFNEPVITNTAKTVIVLPTGLASASPARGKLHVFPNPTENTLNISGIQLENGKAQIRLTDIYGKLILEKTITSNTTELETSKLPAGLYLVQAGSLRATFVKQ